MALVRDPVLTPVPIARLRPTQITVGLREVKEKRRSLRKRPTRKIGRFLGDHMIPVILGPNHRHYIIDHHHLSLALLSEGIEQVLVTVIADLSMLEPEQFWIVLDHHSWVHPYDAGGHRVSFAKIPKRVDQMKDDPFRSLAGELRRAGGFAKDTTPFSEFLWADFLRRRLDRRKVKAHFAASVRQAMRLAKSQDAHYLPGWCGPS
ncbi:MAG TPA: ParB-like protein [Vicinamibacterales bacterium]|jgi:hypothetical protein